MLALLVELHAGAGEQHRLAGHDRRAEGLETRLTQGRAGLDDIGDPGLDQLADAGGAAAHERDRAAARLLQPTQHHDLQQMADMQRIRRGIETDIGRHDPGRAVGGGGDDLPAGGVFLVHRHRIGRQPVVDDMGRGEVHPPLGQQ